MLRLEMAEVDKQAAEKQCQEMRRKLEYLDW